MGIFLKAAFEVLKRHGEALSPRDLVANAQNLGLLSTRGKTPAQTMKAKLSTDILKHGDKSLFMRAAQGKFALREWDHIMKEYVAERFKKKLFDEDIVVLPLEALQMFVPSPGLWKNSDQFETLTGQLRRTRRSEAEGNLSVVQLVSVFIVRHADQILTYKRTRRLPEARLHHFYSLIFGGHLNPDDIAPLFNIFDPKQGQIFLERELHEELRLSPGAIREFVYRGLLYDDSQPVSKQHLGVAYEILVNSLQFEIGERGFLMDAKYESVGQIQSRRHEFENWSLLLLDKLGGEWK